MRAVGLRGQRAGALTLADAVDLLVAGLRGRRRRAAVRQRIVTLVAEQQSRLPNASDALAADQARWTLHRLLSVQSWESAALSAGVAALALHSADDQLLAAVGTWLGGDAGTHLYQLAAAESGLPTLAIIDIEARPGANLRIDEFAVVVARGDRILRRIELRAPIDPRVVTATLAGHVVVAHNGDGHDFPLLEAHGVTVPQHRIDTLRWAWLAMPTVPSHSLVSLCELLNVQVQGDRHTALVDAEMLQRILTPLLAQVRALPGTTRHRLSRLLSGHVSPAVLDHVLALGAVDRASAPTADGWQRVSSRPVAGQRTRVVQQCPDVRAWRPSDRDQLVVVRDLRVAFETPGLWASGDQLIDPSFSASAPDGSGWSAALALRMEQTARGLVGLWPPSATSLLDEIPRRSDGAYVLGEGPWLTDVASVRCQPPDRPTVLVDAVELLFGGVDDRLDPADLEVPVTAVVDHAGPSRPEMSALWQAVLGGPVSIVGQAASLTAPVTVVSGIPGSARASVATARALAVACGRAVAVPTVLVTSGVRADMVVAAIGREVRSWIGAPLLHPPAWPTITEAAHRLHERPHLAVTTSGPAPRLASSGAELVLDRIGAPSSDNPVVTRMLDAAENAYGQVIEPISALRLLRLLVNARAATWICDPAADNPLLRAAISSSGARQDLQPIDRLENTDVGRWATQAMRAAAAGRPEDIPDPRAHLPGAVSRLLGAHARLRPEQQTVIDSVLDGHDVLAVFRTGFGKSLCYQAPALALGAAGHGATVVISPLIALQRDQITTLRRRRVWEATAVNSDLDPVTRGARLRGIRAGFYRVVYVAPEGLQSEGLRDALMTAGVALVAVDEAHCISEMGHDFRPDYRTIPLAVRRILGFGDDVRLSDLGDRPRMLALTGTASPQTRDDIVERLDGRFRRHVDAQFVRPELTFDVVDVSEDPGRTGDVATDHPQRWHLLSALLRETETPAIVYAPTKRDTNQLAELLTTSLGRKVEAYHAGRSADDRARIERAFLDGHTDMVVATNAFGMGVDKPDIRTVLHWRMPGSPEALYQEAGRAGRGPEGQPARCVVLYHPSDLAVAARIATWTVPNRHELASVWSTLEELHRLQGERGSVVVSDEDLTRLAGLRPGIEASVVIAHLGNSGLITERERQPAAVRVIGTGVPLPPDLPMTEQAIAQLLPRGQEVTALSPAAIADWLANAGLATSLRDIRAAIRHLEAVGVVGYPPPTVGIRSLSSDPGAVVAKGWDDARRVARHIPSSGWVSVGPRETDLPADRIIAIIELLAVLGCVKVGQQSRGGFLPSVSRGARPLKGLTRLAEMSPRIVTDAGSSTASTVDLVALAERHGVSVDETREALLVGHILQAVMLDPRSWEQPGLTGSCRRLTIEQHARPPESLIDETASATRSRKHDSDLRRQSLHAYAELDPPEGDGVAYQEFLERYFTDPTFLSDIEARDTRRILDGLDDDQLAAVRSVARWLVIRAGAGTGKTRVLTRRIAFRVATGQATSSEIVAVCFGKDAASEMSVRLAALGVAGVRVQTLNALGWQIIREHWPKLGWGREPELIKDQGQQTIIADLTRRHGDKPVGAKVKSIIERAKLGLVRPGAAEGGDGVPSELVNAVYAEYDEWLVANDKVDYQDQIVHAVSLLRHADVAGHVCGPVREVFVDEAQDLSAAEWALVHALSGSSSLTVVGDPRQAINEWKGADPALFDKVSAESRTVTVDLVRNYRSRAQLLDAPNRVMAAYPPLEANDTSDGDASAVDCTDEKQHDEYIADLVRGWLDDGVADDEIAVICPTNDQVRRLAGHLGKAGVRTRMLGLPPLHRTETFRIAQAELPRSYDPETDDMIAAMERLATRPDVEDAIVAAAPSSDDDPWSDWHRLTAELADRERNGIIDPTDALARVAKESRSAGDATGGVAVATIHKSKGLEWDAVVFAEATAKSLRDKPEDRRLAYVALTRARSRRRVVSHADGGGRSAALAPPAGHDGRGHARSGQRQPR